MSELLGTLMNMFSGDGLTQLSEKAGVDKKSTGKALTAILPSLIHALGRKLIQSGRRRILDQCTQKRP
jgi:hypothetical protein